MLEYLKREANLSVTENGAVTYESTGSECLNLFATIGALRCADDDEILTRFIRAYAENPNSAMKLFFFARDVRGGLGERRVFRVILSWLAKNEPETVKKNIANIAEYGRYDDLLSLLGTPCQEVMLSAVKEQLVEDVLALEEGKPVSLLAKWLPSVNASSEVTKNQGKKIAKALGLSYEEYRKTLSALRAGIHILENNLRQQDYTFDYGKQPSRALYKYRKAFHRNDGERYHLYLDAVASGKAVLHADNLSPYELVEPYLTGNGYYYGRTMTAEEKSVLNATWNSLPNYGSNEDALAVIDTSGSMYWNQKPLPAAVALSLGLYFAEHNRGAFKNCFIEFSARPKLIELQGETFADRLRYAASFSEVANTNLKAVFDLILRAALRNHVSQKDIPAKLIIISDMEFDSCVDDASAVNFENARKKYEAHGYQLPQIVFWNVASRNRQQPVTVNDRGVALVSGVTPRLFSMIAGGSLSPYTFMMEILESERYAKIVA
ncbi:MAG: DUF2828 family protein [Oscillospiraceae bacterium]|nr:DUF2828 family protein [Oscillospiraceae bacterium]